MNALNATSTSTSTPSSPSAFPYLSAFPLASLVSMPALFDYAKFMFMGSMLPMLQHILSWAYSRALATFFFTASFQEEDPAFQWMMVWLAKHPAWRKARDVEITTRTIPGGSARFLDDDSAAEIGARRFSYLPSLTTSHWMWYRYRWVGVSRTKETTGYFGRQEETLVIRILTWDHKVLAALLCEARDTYKAAQDHQIGIYASDGNNNWRLVASRPKRSLRSIVLEPGVKEDILEDAQEFLDSKEWYNDRGIPFRRGYMLYGEPGTGKTSLIHSIAGELGLDVYILTLSRAGLDDTTLSDLIADLPEKCIAIMEDIDAAFTRGLNRDTPNAPTNPTPQTPAVDSTTPPANQTQIQATSESKVTLSGLLNAIDGVGAQEGRILFATTNKYQTLDPALCRPGRMDLHIEFKLASRYQARELFKAFYEPRKKERKEDDEKEPEDKEKWERDSGFEEKLVDVSPPPSPKRKTRRLRGPELSTVELEDLASRFAEAIPDRECSMASLQGYLMQYKTKPYDALTDTVQWAEREREKKMKKCDETT